MSRGSTLSGGSSVFHRNININVARPAVGVGEACKPTRTDSTFDLGPREATGNPEPPERSGRQLKLTWPKVPQ